MHGALRVNARCIVIRGSAVGIWTVRHRERTLSNSNPTIRALCVCEVTSLESYVVSLLTNICAEFGAQGEIRTLTPVKAGDFESPASTIPPLGHWVGD
jgi:hypothetical protein